MMKTGLVGCYGAHSDPGQPTRDQFEGTPLPTTAVDQMSEDKQGVQPIGHHCVHAAAPGGVEEAGN
jgi:hypothetical protein